MRAMKQLYKHEYGQKIGPSIKWLKPFSFKNEPRRKFYYINGHKKEEKNMLEKPSTASRANIQYSSRNLAQNKQPQLVAATLEHTAKRIKTHYSIDFDGTFIRGQCKIRGVIRILLLL